ncbi:MAG: peptidoglycan DD-metalloendopeptidase family protein [Patescibacteria group bacterium]
MRKLRQLFIIPALAIALLPLTVGSATVDELRQKITGREAEIKKLEAEIAQYQGALDKQSSQSKTLKTEITKLETQIKKINTDIKLTEQQIQRTELRLEELDIEIGEKKSALDTEKEVLGSLVRSLYEEDDTSMIEILAGNNTLSEFFERREATESVQEQLGQSLAALRKHKESLETEAERKKREEEELLNKRKDLSGRKTVQQSINQTKSKLLSESKNQETKYQQLLREREEKRALIQKELQAVEDELRRSIDSSLLPSKRAGVLGWPVENPKLTQGFGFTEFATTQGSDVYKGNGHNGVDFKAAIGARILASEGGIVKDIGNTDTLCPGGSYGRWVIIEHPNNLSTLYAHLSGISVKKGQEVKRGDLVGFAGDTGYVTGPHLHFTVYASNTYRLAKTKHCGMVPAGGYLNPLEYLGAI